MSMIIHGPQGCGRTRNAELLRKHFKLARVIETDDGHGVYHLLASAAKREMFKAGDALYLTSEEPPAHLVGARRILSFDEAMQQIHKG